MKKILAKDIMKQDILSVGMEWSIDQLADYLIENSISGAPVTTEEGKLLGVVSLTDIVRYRSMPATDIRPNDPHDYYMDSGTLLSPEISDTMHVETPLKVKEIMTPMIFDVKEDSAVQRVADAMIRGRIHRVFVTDEGRLKGIITTMDLLEVIRNSG